VGQTVNQCQLINQPIKQNIIDALCRKLIRYYSLSTETTQNQCSAFHKSMTACHQFDHRLINSYENSKIGYKIIRISHP